MKRLGKSKINELGSMMVEALAMLGLISMVTPVVYKKAAERNTEMQDVNAAAQLRTLVRAVDEYIQDNYDTIIKGETVNNGCAVGNMSYAGFTGSGEQHRLVNIAHLCDYLPYGFLTNAGAVTDNKIFSQNYRLSIKKVDGVNNQKALTGFLVAQPKQGDNFSRIRASRISSMIGGNGGYVENGNAFGVQGMWRVDNINGKLGITGVSDGSIITTSAQPISSGKANYDEVLHRFQKNGRPELNRMETTLSMGSSGAAGQNIENVNRVIITAANTGASGQKESGWKDKALWVQGDAGTYIDGMLQSAKGKFSVDKDSNVKSQGTLGVGGTGADNFVVNAAGNTIAKGTFSAAANNFTVDAAGNTVANGTLSASAGRFLVDASGNTTVKGNLSAEQRVAISGAHDTDASYKLTVNGNAIIKGLLRVTNFKADNIDAGTLKAGTNNVMNNNRQDYTLYTDSSRLVVGATSAADNVGVFNVERVGFTYAKGLRAGLVNGSLYPFTVGNDANSNINMRLRASTSTITARNVANTADLLAIDNSTSSMQAFTSDAQKARVGLNANGTASMSATASSNVSEVYLDANQASLGVSSATGADRNLTVYKYGATAPGGTGTLPRPQVWVRNGTDLKVLNSANDVILNVDQSGAMKDTAYSATSKGEGRGSVYVRKGVIELASTVSGANRHGTNPSFKSAADDMGYVKADMLVSQKTYETIGLNSGYNYFPAATEYNAYMVNPAYTSVMHDIKLTTRGGARLSDILPDFVNKGIYLADNTYTEASIRPADLSAATLPVSKAVSIPEDSPTQASAYLGSVHPPQCPPGYEKVLTIVPKSFKMAEAESVWGGSGRGNDTTLFYHYRDAYEQAHVDNPYNSDPNYQPTPLTFQKNTFLQTRSVKHGGDGVAFKGWSVLMGFVYPTKEFESADSRSYWAKNHSQTLKGVDNGQEFAWNLYPVYSRTLESMVTVYCFFRRSAFSNSTGLIDTSYDYLDTLKDRTLITKPGAYKTRLNDPKLNYDSAW